MAQRVPQALVSLPTDERVASSGAPRPNITSMVVDLPAPFGPTKPITRPGSTMKVMPSRARVGPKRLRGPATSIACPVT